MADFGGSALLLVSRGQSHIQTGQTGWQTTIWLEVEWSRFHGRRGWIRHYSSFGWLSFSGVDSISSYTTANGKWRPRLVNIISSFSSNTLEIHLPFSLR